jgi:predicted DNA-binding transcriptional regulator AlpA
MSEILLRFRDLKARGIVTNWVTLKRWVDARNFPPGIYLGPGSRAWRESDIEAWLNSRPTTKESVTEAA